MDSTPDTRPGPRRVSGIRRAAVMNGITAGVIALAVVVFALALAGSLGSRATLTNDAIGLVEIEGVIADSRDVNRQIRYLAETEKLPVIVLRLNSPGGGVTASEEIWREVKRIREEGVVVVSSMGTVAASGAYYIAAATDTIMANASSLTGSIGVIAEFTQLDTLLAKIGMHITVIKTGKYKDTGSAFRPMREDEREYIQDLIGDSYDQFVRAVAEGRGLSEERVRELAEGKVYTGSIAREVGLVDTIGNFQDALDFAKELAGYSHDADVLRAPQKDQTGILGRLVERVGLAAEGPSMTLSYRMP